MENEKAYFIEITSCEGSMTPAFGFVPDTDEGEWPRFRVLGLHKNQVIDEIIAKLRSMKIPDIDKIG